MEDETLNTRPLSSSQAKITGKFLPTIRPLNGIATFLFMWLLLSQLEMTLEGVRMNMKTT